MFSGKFIMTKIVCCLSIVSLLFSYKLEAQVHIPPAEEFEYYYRILQVSGLSDVNGSFTIRPFSPRGESDDWHPWHSTGYFSNEKKVSSSSRHIHLNLFEPVFFQSYNTHVPRGANDGAIWQGKGYNMAVSAGVYAKAGPLYIFFRPQAGMAQNLEFDLGPYPPAEISVVTEDYFGEATEFAYRGFRGVIDYVQRYGDATFNWFDLGQSSVELRYSGLRLALSNTLIWTGPAVHNSLQFGYNAPGFKHLYLGTYRPIQTPAGSFEFFYLFGGTRKSDYFDKDGAFRSRQSVNSLFVTYSPRFIPGLSAGALRTFFHSYPTSFSEYRFQSSKLFEAIVRAGLGTPGLPDGYDPDNQVASVFLRWVFPSAGFEVYSEYGRNDHNADLRDFRRQPNHQRAYTLGLIKTSMLKKSRLLVLNIEINQFEPMRTALSRGDNYLGGWYTHAQQVFGLTNDGQIMGSGYGPGVNMQMLKTDVYHSGGRLGMKIARIAYHNSRVDQYFHFIQAANENFVEHDDVRNIEILVGAEITKFFRHGIELSAVIDQSLIFNHHNLKGNDITNTRFELVLRKQVRGWLR